MSQQDIFFNFGAHTLTCHSYASHTFFIRMLLGFCCCCYFFVYPIRKEFSGYNVDEVEVDKFCLQQWSNNNHHGQTSVFYLWHFFCQYIVTSIDVLLLYRWCDVKKTTGGKNNMRDDFTRKCSIFSFVSLTTTDDVSFLRSRWIELRWKAYLAYHIKSFVIIQGHKCQHIHMIHYTYIEQINQMSLHMPA